MFFIVIFQFSSARAASQGMTVSAPSNQNLTASASAKATASQKQTIILGCVRELKACARQQV